MNSSSGISCPCNFSLRSALSSWPTLATSGLPRLQHDGGSSWFATKSSHQHAIEALKFLVESESICSSPEHASSWSLMSQKPHSNMTRSADLSLLCYILHYDRANHTALSQLIRRGQQTNTPLSPRSWFFESLQNAIASERQEKQMET